MNRYCIFGIGVSLVIMVAGCHKTQMATMQIAGINDCRYVLVFGRKQYMTERSAKLRGRINTVLSGMSPERTAIDGLSVVVSCSRSGEMVVIVGGESLKATEVNNGGVALLKSISEP